MLTSVKLVDGAREMVLLPRESDGIYLKELDAPMPDIREVVELRSDDDGTRDSTTLFGARACSIELLVMNNPRGVEDELGRYLHPRSRPYLVVADDGWTQERRLGLRVSQFDKPLNISLPRTAGRISAGWRVPTGIWEAATEVEETVLGDLASATGRAYPRAHPWAYEATLSTGASLITNLGSVPSHFVARLYGPCTAPALLNETTGETLAFTSGLVLGAGQYVEVDTRDRTAYLLSSTSASRLSFIDFTRTSWWRIEPGQQQIRYAPGQTSAGAQAVITYRPSWL